MLPRTYKVCVIRPLQPYRRLQLQQVLDAGMHCDLPGVTCPLLSIATDSKSFASGKTKSFIGTGEGH